MSKSALSATQILQTAADHLSPPAREFDFSNEDFRSLAKVAYDYAGIALSEGKRNLVYSRLSRRLRTLQLQTFREYRQYLAENPSEIENFINSISTNHTKFFREDHHFDHLREHVAIPFAKSGTRGNGRMRVWSAGCSSGEEPYTIAVVLKREIHTLAQQDVKVLATDIDTEVLNRAARGEYAEAAISDVPRQYQEYFHLADDRGSRKVVIDPEIRSIIAFRRLNLMQEKWPFSGLFDVIFCRNVMIYFDGPTKTNLINRFTSQLKPGGFLYIGHSESLIGTHPKLQSMGRTIYRRVD